MAKSEGKTISLKCYSDSESEPDGLTVRGTGDFAVGLTAEDKVLSCKTNDKTCHQICVPLFKLTIWPTEGVTLTPVNRDLICIINEAVIISETNLVSGMKIEIGDKLIEYMEGPVPRARRHLPPTPGVPVRASPPPKPTRNRQSPQPPKPVVEDDDSDWCHIELPAIEEELIEKLNTCEELANMSACCINKQIHQYTDTRMTATLMDEIFSMLQDIGTHRKDILKSFLKEMARESQDTPESDKGRPLHTPVINLLVEILRQFMDPVTLVILCLKLLRSLSHVPNNLPTIIGSQATAAILGSMSVYVDKEVVQQNGIDILCKVATYTPSLNEKAPMRETAIELILRAMQHHTGSLFVIQSGCRTLANLCNTLFELANQIIDNERSKKSNLSQTVEKLVNLLDYMNQSATGIVHIAMRNFTSDLSVTMEGRRFLYVMARLDQLKQKQSLWLENDAEETIEEENEDENSREQGSDDEGSVEGILKRSRSFENLRSSERRVSFVDISAPGVYETTSEDSSGSDADRQKSESKMESQKSEVTVISEIKIHNGFVSGNNEQRPYTTTDIAEGLKQSEIPQTDIGNGQDSVQNTSRPDIVTSTMSAPDSVSGMSLFSELGQMDKGLARRLEEAESQRLGGGYEMLEEDEDEDEVVDYSAADVKFLNRLVKTQIICRVCSLAFMDEDKQAYSVIEQPIRDALKTEKMAPALLRFFTSQYKPELTMMDFDTNIVISLIDAVRYRSQVAPDVVQKTLQGVARNISDSVNKTHLKLAARILAKILEEPSLQLTVSDASFHSQLRAQLEETSQTLSDSSVFSHVLSKLTPGHSLMDLDCY